MYIQYSIYEYIHVIVLNDFHNLFQDEKFYIKNLATTQTPEQILNQIKKNQMS